jgi:exopolysaccharide biosynthesis polyprenyl glycosylphosphotransferase
VGDPRQRTGSPAAEDPAGEGLTADPWSRGEEAQLDRDLATPSVAVGHHEDLLVHGQTARARRYAEAGVAVADRGLTAVVPRVHIDPRTADLIDRRRRSGTKRRGWLVRRMLLLADMIGLLAAFLIAEAMFGNHGSGLIAWWLEIVSFVLTLPMWVVVAKVYGLYDHDEERTDNSTTDDIPAVFHVVTVGAWLVFAGMKLARIGEPDLGKVGLFWATAIVGISLARAGARAFCRQHVSYQQNTVILGTDEVGRLVAEKIARHSEYGLNLVGFVDSEERLDGCPAGQVSLGSPEELPEIVRRLDVERVLVAHPDVEPATTLELIRELNNFNTQVDIVPRFFEVIGPNLSVHSVEGLPLIGLSPLRLPRSSVFLKRLMDLSLSAIGVLLLSPLFAVAALAIRLDSRGSVFFRQERVGSGDRRFLMWKFRTMAPDADAHKQEFSHLNRHAENGDGRMFKIPDDPRVTRVGRFLRRYSIDELPQLFNVVKGEMSLVGPRPLIPDEDCFVDGWARRRLGLKPGITGLWQVLGSSTISFSEMVRLDCMYVAGWSLGGDLSLLLRTVPLVLCGANRG